MSRYQLLLGGLHGRELGGEGSGIDTPNRVDATSHVPYLIELTGRQSEIGEQHTLSDCDRNAAGGVSGHVTEPDPPRNCSSVVLGQNDSELDVSEERHVQRVGNGFEHIDILADSGMNEIRYNTAATGYDNERVMKIIEYSAKKIANVTVEIPILLKDKEKLLSMIPRYAEAGVKFINLHELMREKNTRSQNLKTENFKAFTLEDGHTTEISLDSRIAFREMIREIKKIPVKINVNFCSLMNKLRQTRKRRNNIIRLIKTPYEKIVDEQFLESVLILGDKENYQFMNPDEWQSNRHKIKTDNNMLIRKIAPMSIFKRSRYISVTKV